jgi:hypothetical protein
MAAAELTSEREQYQAARRIHFNKLSMIQMPKGTADLAMNILIPTWSLPLVLLVGCAVSGLNTKEPPAEAVSRPSPSPEELTHRFDYWYEEATELHEMAARREREADVLSKNKEGNSAEELVTRMRALAQQLHAAAEYAEEQAQEAQRQVPQEMTQ